MNRGEAIERIKQTMSHKEGMDTIIGTAIDEVQRILEHSWPVEFMPWLPWFLVTERLVSSTVENEERVLLPDGFIMEYEQDALWIVNDLGGEYPLKKYDADDLRLSAQERYDFGTYTQATTDTPQCYALTGDYWRLFPKPLTVQTLKVMIYAEDDLTVELTDENKWLKYIPMAIIGAAGERVVSGSRDKYAEEKFIGWKSSAISAISNISMMRQLANRRMAIGETH